MSATSRQWVEATHETDRHPRHAAQCARRANDGVHARVDAPAVGRTVGEDPALSVGLLDLVHDEANSATGASSDRKRGKEDAGWYGRAEGDGRK